MKTQAANIANDSQIVDDIEYELAEEEQSTEETLPDKAIDIRQNFNETAFFYPHIHADSTGLFRFSATLPESITRWNLDILAHSTDLYSGSARYTLSTQKEVMVEMHLPRFIRQSDSWTLKANVVNLTNQQLNPTVRLTITDPAQDTLVFAGHFTTKNLELPAGRSTDVEWNIPAIGDISLVSCKIEAFSGSFSDGEQRYLPVLSDRILVTESVPFSIQEGESMNISFERAIDPLDVKQVVLEFTSNPVWAAVQALPLLSVPESHNSIDLVGAWYSTAISSKLIHQMPELRQVIRELKATGKTHESLQSNLEKNKDLQLLILEATPWLADARDQTEQQRQLIRLFDHNQHTANEHTLLAMLSKLQLETGAFAWMEGMQANRQITQLIAEKMSALYNDTTYSNKHMLRPLLHKALAYLDNQLNYDFMRVKANHPKYLDEKHLSLKQLQHMTLRSALLDYQSRAPIHEAMNYYQQQIIQYRHSFTIYEKAMAALYFIRTDQQEYANQMLRSLKEMAVHTTSKAMHWPTLQTSWKWDEQPLRIHIKIVEAFSAADGYEDDIEKMKIWLLNQKRTQHWDNRLTTLEAVMVLLTTGEKWFNTSRQYTFQANQQDIIPEAILPGSGYSRTQLPATVNSVHLTTSTSNNPSQAWGSLHRQSMRPIHEVEAAGSILSIERNYFILQHQDNNQLLEPINKNTTVQAGDKIISRITVRAEQAMNYVVIIDNKAAGLETVNPLTNYDFKSGFGYVRTPGDIATRYFIDYLPKGIHIIEEQYYVSHSGQFSTGIAQLQCMYAPEYTANSEGGKLTAKPTE